jgi:hypothetical protein
MTLIIGVVCRDGVVVGGDRLYVKIRATSIKSFSSKLYSYEFGDGRG